MTEDEIFSFVASSIPSIWALELLLLLRRLAPDGQREDELVSELRSSTTAVSEALHRLHGAGLVIEETGVHYYHPVSSVLDQLATETEKLYAIKPVSVVKAIMSPNNRNLQIFANSFKIRE